MIIWSIVITKAHSFQTQFLDGKFQKKLEDALISDDMKSISFVGGEFFLDLYLVRLIHGTTVTHLIHSELQAS